MTIGATHSFLLLCRRHSAWTDLAVLAVTSAIGRNGDSGRDDSVRQGSVDRDGYWIGHNKSQISTKEFLTLVEKKSDRDKKYPTGCAFLARVR